MISKAKISISAALNYIESKILSEYIWFNTRHLHGPEKIVLSNAGVMAVILARDAEYFIDKCISHHLSIGVNHILVIDNGSNDSTINICKKYENLTLLSNKLPARKYESLLRSELARRVALGGWILFADADELVEPYGDRKDGLGRITKYCNEMGYTAVLGQMLDRFSSLPYSISKRLDYHESVLSMDMYSLNLVNSIPYSDKDDIEFCWFLRDNRCVDPRVGFRTGGIRTEVFKENPFLSKHSLVRNQSGLILMSHPHCASRVDIADVTLLLHHYKLAGDWMARDRASVQDGRWGHGEDAKRLRALPDVTHNYKISPSNPKTWRGMESLVDEGFIYASPNFIGSTR